MTISNAITIVMTIKSEYLIDPGQTADCAYKLDKSMFRAYHSSLIYKYYCVSLFTCICQISLFYISLLYDVTFCVKSIKQTDKVARSIVLFCQANIQDHQAKEFLKQLIQRGQSKAAVEPVYFCFPTSG